MDMFEEEKGKDKRDWSIELIKEVIDYYHITQIKEQQNHFYYYDYEYKVYKTIKDQERAFYELTIKYVLMKYKLDIAIKDKKGLVDNIRARAKEISEQEIYNNLYFLPLKSKLIDLRTMEEREYSPDIFLVNHFQVDYKPNAYSEIVDKELDVLTCNDKEYRNYLLECMATAFILMPKKIELCFILYGTGWNGKSMVLNWISAMTGALNTGDLNFNELSQGGFYVEDIEDKAVNISPEQRQGFFQTDIIKMITSGEPIKINRKFQPPYKYKPYCRMFFSCNEPPKFNDYSYGIQRRLKILPFKATFTEETKDPTIEENCNKPEALDYLFSLIYEKILFLIKNNYKMSKCKAVERETSNFIIDNDLNKRFLLEYEEEHKNLEGHGIYGESTGSIFKAYKDYCEENKIKNILSRKKLREKILQTYKNITYKAGTGNENYYESIDGKYNYLYQEEYQEPQEQEPQDPQTSSVPAPPNDLLHQAESKEDNHTAEEFQTKEYNLNELTLYGSKDLNLQPNQINSLCNEIRYRNISGSIKVDEFYVVIKAKNKYKVSREFTHLKAQDNLINLFFEDIRNLANLKEDKNDKLQEPERT